MNSSSATTITEKIAASSNPGVIQHSSASTSASSSKYTYNRANAQIQQPLEPQQELQQQQQKTFSEDDVDLLVRLVLAGEWHHVHFYFNFLISHYQKYLVFNGGSGSSHYDDATSIPRTSNIINNLYELLVNIKVQQYFEALESGDMRTVSELIHSDLPTLQLYIHPHLYQQIQLFSHDREAFKEYKQTVLKLNESTSCSMFRNLVANDVREGLTSLVHMYNNNNNNNNSNNYYNADLDSQAISHHSYLNEEGTTQYGEDDRCSVSSRNNSPVSESAIADDSLDYLDRGVSATYNVNQNKRKYSVIEEPTGERDGDSMNDYSHAKKSDNEVENTARPLLSSWKRARRPSSHDVGTNEFHGRQDTKKEGENGMDALLKAFHIVNSPESSPPPQAIHPPPPPNQPSSISESLPSQSNSNYRIEESPVPYQITKTDDTPKVHPPTVNRKKRHNSPKASGSRRAKLDPNLEKRITESLDFKAIKNQNQKSIKPTVKLCTGGITSTPALRERMFKVLEQFDTPCTWDCIQSKVSGNRAKVWATLCMLVNAGVVIQSGKGRRGHPYKYILSPDLTSEKLSQLEIKFRTLDSEAQKIHKQYKQEMQRQQLQEQLRNTQEFSQHQPQQTPQITSSSASSQTKTTKTNTMPNMTLTSHGSSSPAFSRGSESREPRLLSGRVDV